METNRSPSQRITAALSRYLQGIVESCDATAVLIYADALECEELSLPQGCGAKVFYMSHAEPNGSSGRYGVAPCEDESLRHVIRVPNVNLTRIGLVKMGVFLAWSQGLVRSGEVIVCVTGVRDSGRLDTLVITEVGKENEVLSTGGDEQLPAGIMPQVLERVIDIAVELGTEGREGKPVGALFVVGDAASVVPLSKQLILNPFKGYAPHERNLLDPDMEETAKELSTIDGAFIVDGDGVIVTCGSLLKTGPQENEYPLPQGLGARHHAAAGITAVTHAIAVAVSESTGTVTVFRHGRIVTEIEKPRSVRRREL